jgi:nucleotide-binding universal stress UspA family protein
MTRRGRPGPVVVGVDEAGSAENAVDWATAEAAARGCRLRVVHAFRPPLPADAYGFASPIDSFVTAHTAAQLILGDAVTRARSVAPGIDVSTRPARGTAARALLGEARDARLLVLGSRGRSGLRAVLSGSVAGPVSRHSPCPIVVIRPFANRPADRVSLRSAPRVVVGIDPAASRSAATGFAFHAASQRGIPLTVLSAWTPNTAADIEPTLLVVGSSGRGHLRGLLCGSVSRTVLRDAGCPVAIVGRDRTTAGRTTAGRMTAALTRAEHGAVLQSGSTGRPRRQVFWIHRASQ